MRPVGGPLLVAISSLLVFGVFCASSPAWAADVDTTAAESADMSSVGKIGQLEEKLRRARTRDALYREATDIYADYSKLKARVEKETGLYWSMDVSYLQQWGRPDGGSPAGQLLAFPNVDWKLFNSKSVGEGSVQLAYSATRYLTSHDGEEVQNALGLITPINDYPARSNIFSQLTYTHSLPGNRLLISAGQYSFFNFDDNAYLNNQQRSFINYVFSQNGSETYPNAGLGAFAQLNATTTLQFAAGFQNAANISGATLSGKGFGDNGFAWFGYAQWTPTFHGTGSAQYSMTYYQVPTVPSQPRTSGWSVNAVQNLDARWAVFARANRAYDHVTPIRSSYALGFAINDPFARSPTDQIALAFGYSDAAPPPTNPPNARNEKLAEIYWNWTFAKGLLLTPDVQYIRDPALNPTRDSVWVLTLRATLMF
jgi:hypothetical protein